MAQLDRSPLDAGQAVGTPNPALQKLNIELLKLDAEWFAEMIINDDERIALEAEIEKATGIASCDAPHDDGKPVGYWATRERIIDGHPSHDPYLFIMDSINKRLYPLAREILRHKATSYADLAIQAHAVMLMHDEIMDKKDDDDYDEIEGVRLFFNLACALFGIDPAPARVARRRSSNLEAQAGDAEGESAESHAGR